MMILLKIFLSIAFSACGTSSSQQRDTNNNKILKPLTDSSTATATGSQTGTKSNVDTSITNSETSTSPNVEVESIQFPSQGIALFGEIQKQISPPNKKMAILLHSEDSNHHEYDWVLQNIHQAGFDTIAMDLRTGGTKYGFDNKTVVEETKTESDFTKNKQDISNLISYATKSYDTVILTGSNFSANLSLMLTPFNSSINGVAAFSPTDNFTGNQIYNFINQITVSAFIAAPKHELTNLPVMNNENYRSSVGKDFSEEGGSGSLLLQNSTILNEYINFLKDIH